MADPHFPGADTVIGMSEDPASLIEDAEIFRMLSDQNAQRRQVLDSIIASDPEARPPMPARFTVEDDEREVEYHEGDDFEDDDDDDPELAEMLEEHRSSGGGGGGGGGGAPAVEGLRERAERQELSSKLYTMTALGFNLPAIDYVRAPLEELKSLANRVDLVTNTVSYVNMVCTWIQGGAKLLETINGLLGNFLPLPDYATKIREGTNEPRFKFALYTLIVRYGGAGMGFGEWKQILLVLLLPLVQAVVIKVVALISKARGVPISTEMISQGVDNGVGSFTKLWGGNKNDGGGVFDGDQPQSSDSEYESSEYSTEDEADHRDDGSQEYFPKNDGGGLRPPPDFIIPS
jgi:hypothetical protein